MCYASDIVVIFNVIFMILIEQLEKLGLSENQAKIYLSFLEKGPQFLQELSKNTRIKRTTLYLSIGQMIEKDLVEVIIKSRRKQYYIKNPQLFLRRIRERYNLLDALMPQLSDAFEGKSVSNRVKFYDTQNGLKEVLKEIVSLDRQVEILTIESNINAFFSLGFDFWKEIVAKKKVFQIKSRTLISSAEKEDFLLKDHQIQIRTSSLLNDFKISLYLYADKVTIFIPEDSLCLVIENDKIKKSLAIMFEVVWRRAKPYFKGQ